MPAIVIINRHEPEGEVAGRLLELADEKGHPASVVEAQRGEVTDANLSFRVPQDVADAFEADRAERWPVPEEQTEAADATDPNAPQVRTNRPTKAAKSTRE